MRRATAVLAAFLISAVTAFAAQTEGQIRKIDSDAFTITLDDGKSYKLPGEFDISDITEGTTVVVAYDVVGGVNLITDMEIAE